MGFRSVHYCFADLAFYLSLMLKNMSCQNDFLWLKKTLLVILFERQGSEGWLLGNSECSTPQAWKQNIKAMWYEVHLLISSSEKQIFEIVLLCSVTDKVRSGDRGGRDNLPGEIDRLPDWVMSILTCNMTREHNTDPHWPTGWSTHLGWDEMRWGTKHSGKGEELYRIQQKCLRMYPTEPSVGKSETTSVLLISCCSMYLMIHLIIVA